MITEILIALILGYIIGSFPTAYVFLKKTKKINIIENGSGNVGAMNSYKVTKSKVTGIIVFTIDFLKGFLPVAAAFYVFDFGFEICGALLLGLITGHCFSFVIKFKGGKGLATALGGSILAAPAIPVLWIIFWAIAFLFKKNINFGNISATLLTLILNITSTEILVKYMFMETKSETYYSLISTLILGTILIKHYKPIKDYISNVKSLEVKENE